MPKIRRAIVSVTDKSGVVEFCRVLQGLNIEILSTGGTAKVLREAGLIVKDVGEYTGFPEVMDGRLKTLHPLIEGGILARRDNPEHVRAMQTHGIEPIDLVVVNLYAFEETIARSGTALADAIENIDIGGPTMIRAAAKNYQDVTVVVDPADYVGLIHELQESQGGVAVDTNLRLALKVFQVTSVYDAVIYHYLRGRVQGIQSIPDRMAIPIAQIQELRYGENPHMGAKAFYTLPPVAGSLAQARQLHGKELSFNNYLDLEAALNTVREFEETACVIIKHTNPCGVAVADQQHEAFLQARAGDPVSAFGGIIGFNRKVDLKTAGLIGETFFECIIAPGYEDAALQLLQSKKNIRLMLMEMPISATDDPWDIKKICGGLLIQDRDTKRTDLRSCLVVTKRKPTADELDQLDFAWRVCKHVKSNAIIFTKGRRTVGIGAGQMSRVDSTRLAAAKAVADLTGAVAASDAFFPFRDGLDEIAKHGIKAIVQPGGSVRDDEVIQAADEHGMAMVFTGIRHFKH